MRKVVINCECCEKVEEFEYSKTGFYLTDIKEYVLRMRGDISEIDPSKMDKMTTYDKNIRYTKGICEDCRQKMIAEIQDFFSKSKYFK